MTVWIMCTSLSLYIYIYISEVGGVSPTGKSFRFVSCVRARGGCRVRSGQKDKVLRDRFPFSLFPPAAFPFSLSSS